MFQSLISTADPFSAGQKRSASTHQQAYRGSSGADARSRDAYARAMADTGRNSVAASMDEYRQQYQKRAERARSAALLAQRGAAQGQYELGRTRDTATRQQDTRLTEGRQEIQQFRDLSRLRARQQLMNSLVGAVFGSNNAVHLAPSLGTAIAGGARPFAGVAGGGTGLFSTLMGGR
jgi:hypothetical protein